MAGVGGEAMEAGPIGAGEEGASDLRVEGDAALQPARAQSPQQRRRRAQEVRHRQQIVDSSLNACRYLRRSMYMHLRSIDIYYISTFN